MVNERRAPRPRPVYAAAKRTLDVVASGVGLVLFSPLLIVAALGVLLLATLAFIPYGSNAAEAGQQQVKANGQQFAWTVTPNTIKANVPARFAVTASDVNHGFAVYNSDNVMLFQIQAVPDATSHIVYTFKRPGRYQVVCLEFCGLDHHKMIGTFRVAE